MPDATTLMGFRHLLEANKLHQAILMEVNRLLKERGLLMNQGTLIAAPSSTKNEKHERDPGAPTQERQPMVPFDKLRTGFGMKAHIGADDQSGLVHTMVSTTANVSKIAELLHGENSCWSVCRICWGSQTERDAKETENHVS